MFVKLMFALSVSLSGLHSSDSEGHFDTPEAATPVRTPPTFPGELENNNADPDKTGEATANQKTVREREIKHKERESRRRAVRDVNTLQLRLRGTEGSR